MNPTKSELLVAIADAVNAVVSNNGEMSDSQCKDAYNAVLAAIKTVDPVKGTPTVKY